MTHYHFCDTPLLQVHMPHNGQQVDIRVGIHTGDCVRWVAAECVTLSHHY